MEERKNALAELRNYSPTMRDRFRSTLESLLSYGVSPEIAYRAANEATSALDVPAAVGSFGSNVLMQPVRAGEAVGNALADPTIPNMTDAGFQTGLALMQPGKALGALGAGYGAAALSDSGMTPQLSDDANAGQRKRTREFANGFTEEQLKPLSEQTGTPIEVLGMMRRKELSEMLSNISTARGTRQAEAEAEDARLRRERLAAATSAAEAARDRELQSDTSFASSNSLTKQVFDKTGGATPMAAAFGMGALTRLGTGPGSTAAGKAFKDYAAPIAAGTGAAFGTMNVPQFTDMMAPTYNPKKAAAMAYAQEMRLAGFDDEAAKAAQVAASMPDENPVQQNAYEQFYEQLPKRLGVAAIEGATFGKGGASLVSSAGRGFNAVKGAVSRPPPEGQGPGGRTGQQSTGPGGQPPTGGTGVPPGATGATPTPPPMTGPKPRSASSKPLSRAEKDAILEEYRKNPNLNPTDLATAFPSLAGREGKIQEQMREIDGALKATGKRSRESAFDVVGNISSRNLALAGVGAGAAGFAEVLREFGLALRDLDGDGQPDVVVNESPQYPTNALAGGAY